MMREEDEDATDANSRADNDGRRQHEAEFYRDDKDQRGKDDDDDHSARGANGSRHDTEADNTAPDVIPMDMD